MTKGLVAIVDEEDYPLVSPYTWCASEKRYTYVAVTAVRGCPGKFIYMHRLITKAPKGALVDHQDGDGLNNRRENLRPCSIAENNRNRRRMQSTNTSGYRGVSWDGKRGRWFAQISVNNRMKHLGHFLDKEAAYRAYVHAARELYGDFAGFYPDPVEAACRRG